jgi:hypothetical protein
MRTHQHSINGTVAGLLSLLFILTLLKLISITPLFDPKVEGRQTASCLLTGKGCRACDDCYGGSGYGGEIIVLLWCLSFQIDGREIYEHAQNKPYKHMCRYVSFLIRKQGGKVHKVIPSSQHSSRFECGKHVDLPQPHFFRCTHRD